MLEPMYKAVSIGGTEGFREADGWEELLRRVHRTEESRGEGRKAELLLNYVKYPGRSSKKSVEEQIHDFTKARDKLEAA